MPAEIMRSSGGGAVKQFSVFAENKVGRLNELVLMMAAEDIHVMALCMVDTTDCTIARVVVDYPEQARALLQRKGFAFNEAEVIAVEINTEANIREVTCALMQAEINIHSIYPFLSRPCGKSGLILRVEDNDLATEVLNQNGIKVLRQSDIAR